MRFAAAGWCVSLMPRGRASSSCHVCTASAYPAQVHSNTRTVESKEKALMSDSARRASKTGAQMSEWSALRLERRRDERRAEIRNIRGERRGPDKGRFRIRASSKGRATAGTNEALPVIPHSGNTSSLSSEELFQVFDVVFAAEEDGRSLMDVGWHNVEDLHAPERHPKEMSQRNALARYQSSRDRRLARPGTPSGSLYVGIYCIYEHATTSGAPS